MANTIVPSDIEAFLRDVAWTFCCVYHTVLKASLGIPIFGWDMLFDIPFLVDWHKTGEQGTTKLITIHSVKNAD